MEKTIYLKKWFFFMAVLMGLFAPMISGSSNAEEKSPSPEGMVSIPAGELHRGSNSDQGYQVCMKNNGDCKKSWFEDENPAHSVQVNGFLIDMHEVTQQSYEKVMGKNPSDFIGKTLPVERVNWSEATEYCKRVGKRLPTEVEWEWAAQGGKRSVFPWGDEAQSRKANFCDRQCGKRWKESQFDDGHRHTAKVGSFPANGYGLFDMAGNVYEWVADWYGSDYYRNSPSVNPKGPDRGSRKVIRGGSWINYSAGVRPSDRTDSKPGSRLNFIGFRCAL